MLVVVKDSQPIGNYLDHLLDKIKNNEKPTSLKKLIFTEHMNSDYLEAILEHLVAKEILRKDVSKKLILFDNTVFTTLRPEIKTALKDKLREVVLQNAHANSNTLAVLGILLETDELYGWSSLLPVIFSKDEMSHATNNLKLRIGIPPKKNKNKKKD